MPESFWEKVLKTETCWLFTGALDRKGCGIFCLGVRNNKRVYINAHKYVYEITYGKIPEGLLCGHTCGVRNCCNPEHLFSGTYDDTKNYPAQRQRNGKTDFRPLVIKNQCSKGHELTPENTYMRLGRGECKICSNKRGAEYRLRQKNGRNRIPTSLCEGGR